MSGEYDDYEDPIEELAGQIADRVVGTPQVQNAISGAQKLFDQIGRGIDRAGEFVARGPRPRKERPPQIKERVHYRTRVVEKPVEAPPNPRVVMGFPPGAQLTRELVKERQRVLAGLWHPDKGGSTESMQRLNSAAEALLREIG